MLTRGTTPPVDTRAPLAHSASSVSAQRVSLTAAKKRSSARPAPARPARYGAAQRLAGCRLRHQSLASFAQGSMIRIRRAPKSMIKVASSGILMTRPRPYLSCVTWSCSANCSAGGAGGAGPKGLVGRRRRVAARAGFITTSMRPRRSPQQRPASPPPPISVEITRQACAARSTVRARKAWVHTPDRRIPRGHQLRRQRGARHADQHSGALGRSRPLPSRFSLHAG